MGKGLPSFERDDGLVVFDLLVANQSAEQGWMLFSRSYGVISMVAPEGLVPGYPGSENYDYRPKIYQRSVFDGGGWTGLGSQTELAWRYGLHQAAWIQMFAGETGDIVRQLAPELGIDMDEVPTEFTMEEADERAHELLLAELSPQQRLDLTSRDHFFVVGAATKNLYLIDISNGFAIVDKLTRELLVSYCLHTEHWIPHDDVALATKLMLEDEELEVECLENARQTIYKHIERANVEDRRAWEIEQELITST